MSLLLRRLLFAFPSSGGNAELVHDVEYTARNFNTSPLTISGLQGDTYDYELVIKTDTVGSDTNLLLRLNADSTSNYRVYYMQGSSSSATASVDDSASSIQLNSALGTAQQGLIRGILSGSSGDERYFNLLYTGDQRIAKTSGYWKNTANEVTSFSVTASASITVDAHIILYRTPKSGSQGTWKLVGSLSWSAETAEKAFSSLFGDTDKQYRLVWEGDQELNIELNNDTTTYTREYLQNAAGTISAANSTSETSIVSDGINSTFIINAETGVKRLVTTSGSNTASAQQSERAHWYDDTATEITSIDCTPAASSTGTAKLYKRLSPNATGDTLNFEIISGGDEDFSATDFSAGTAHTIAGDSMKLLKIEGLLSNASGDIEIRMQLNSDTAANYPEQLLKGDTSTTSAASATRAYIVLGKIQQGDQAQFTHYLYTKSGENRVGLTECSYDENALEKLAQWWSNSADEITSVKIYASTSNGITGNIKVSELI